MTIKQLYDNIESYPNDNMDFCIENVFAWRGIYQEAACEISTRNVSKQYNLEQLKKLTSETFFGWKGGEFTYSEYTPIHFEYDYGSYTNGNYILCFLTNNDNDAIKHIFDRL